ncbi:uncharacterized protein VICG_00154 [Vittaforma corneae ATCC 50505]|uniref:Uncharacterized protein n=1 Tax=Vittaforma corneae (strain ATCC 50505) TaxID=993615 RepID=L2GQE1_VITCO|nr:uncharacterized protein VICG_00154 [Vittaforma corneae ATCC 50505]ELA42839.1 hypothetical protein VICG_00154 [Vittaforma corneae ATCC 50505]
MLRVRIKTRSRAQQQNTTRLDQFFTLYFQNVFFELNAILSDYHSIQEHASRNRIIEFASRKLKDLDLLQTFVKGAFLLKNLLYLKFKGDDCANYGYKIVEMADFLAILYENMKTSFIPRPNFNLALQAFMDYRKLLPIEIYRLLGRNKSIFTELYRNTDQNLIFEEDLVHIHRMMKIYLLRESVDNFRIENGILHLQSKFFTFKLALCGFYQRPQWQLFKVKSYTNSRKVDDQLLRRLATIDSIVKFMKFFESKKKALSVFNLLETKTGFYQNFTGTVNGIDCQGYLKHNDFYCKISNKDQYKKFKNSDIDEIKGYLLDINALKEPKRDEVISQTDNADMGFKPGIFGPNIAIFIRDMFFCLNKAQGVCFFGKMPPICGLAFQKLHFIVVDSKVTAVTENFDVSGQDTIAIENFTNFIECNIGFLMILHELRDLNIQCKINQCLSARSFYVDSSFNLYHLDNHGSKTLINIDRFTLKTANNMVHQNIGNVGCVNIPANYANTSYKDSLIRNLVDKIRLMAVQDGMPQNIEISENKIGEVMVFSFMNITVKITDSIKTCIKTLTEDLQHFNISSGFNYIKKFGIFYTYNLIPTIFTENRLCFDFSDFIDEIVEVAFKNDVYLITGPKMLQIAKMTSLFTANDSKVFHILHKFFLANRFIFLKKVFGNLAGKSDSGEIYLDESKRICLTQEGIKFRSNSPENDLRLTDVLNLERDVLQHLTNLRKQ